MGVGVGVGEGACVGPGWLTVDGVRAVVDEVDRVAPQLGSELGELPLNLHDDTRATGGGDGRRAAAMGDGRDGPRGRRSAARRPEEGTARGQARGKVRPVVRAGVRADVRSGHRSGQR
eukprot:4277601-Prymnesium_polylepis.2